MDRPVKAPKFELIAEGDTPLLEIVGEGHGGYLPEPESLSILDSEPPAPKRDYLPALAAILAVLMLVIAIRVVAYYAVSHRISDNTPLEARAHVVPLNPLPAAVPNAGPVDDTIYYPPPGVALPALISKYEPARKGDGKVVVLAVIDPAGRPVDVKVARGLDPDLNVAALQAAGKWRFHPGMKNGRPFPVLAQFAVEFRP